jgi:hypothetical protein
MLEYFPYINFSKKIAVSTDLWKTEQVNYQQQTAIKKRNFNVFLIFVLFLDLFFGAFLLLARPNCNFIISLIIFISLVILFFVIKTWQKKNLSIWQKRNNRLFASTLKEAIFNSFFSDVKLNTDMKIAQKVAYGSFLYETRQNVKNLIFQYEGFFNQQPFLIHYCEQGNTLGVEKSAFFNLVKNNNTEINHFFCLKNQQLSPPKAEIQHFGYFTLLETEFNFYSSTRGSLAAFIEKNEMILQRLANLKLNFLAISLIDNKVNCVFDKKLLSFWKEIEISQPLTEETLKSYYTKMSDLVTLVSLLQNLEIPTVETPS